MTLGKKHEIIFLILIIVFALFLRLYSLSNSPLWVDEAISAEVSRNIIEKGIPEYDSGLFEGRALVFQYLQAGMMLFFEGELGIRLISVIFGILTLILAYFFAKEFDKRYGLITTLIFALFYLEVFFSRQGRMYQMFQFFFFLSIYLLYKSKDNKNIIYPALLSLIISIDTHLAGIVLCPVFIFYIWKYNKKYLIALPALLALKNFLPVYGIGETSSKSELIAVDYLLGRGVNLLLFIFAIIGIYLHKNKRSLNEIIIIPCVILFLGVLLLPTYATRYMYFFVFFILLYSSLLFEYCYKNYGKIALIVLMGIILITSNLFTSSYLNVVKPVDYNLNDKSAPWTDYKRLNQSLIEDMRSSIIVSYFSLDVSYYIRKPDYVLPFSLNSIGEDQVSYNGLDRYSGARILDSKPEGSYYITADRFSVSKLTEKQKERLDELTNGCSKVHNEVDLVIYYCPYGGKEFFVERVIDGDTFVLGNGDKVRLICIDAFEIDEEKGLMSKKALENMILNRKVRLESDVNDKDEYGRLLRYVFIDDKFVNKEMVDEGMAKIFRYGDDTRKCDEIEIKQQV